MLLLLLMLTIYFKYKINQYFLYFFILLFDIFHTFIFLLEVYLLKIFQFNNIKNIKNFIELILL